MPQGRLLFTLVSAVLLVLAQPPFRIPFLPFLALVPLVVALGRLPPGAGSRGEAARLGAVFGVVHFGILLIWIPGTVGRHFVWAWPGYGLLLVSLGALMALAAWTVRRLAGPVGSSSPGFLPLSLAFALTWVAVEWLRSHLPLGLAWPWMGISLSLTHTPELLGLAEWTGERGVALWLALVNGVLGATLLGPGAVRRGRGPQAARPGPGLRAILLPALALAALLAPALLGHLRARSLPLEPGPTVAVVGTRVPPHLRLRPEAAAREALSQVSDHLDSLDAALPPVSSGAPEAFRPDLVVLPEATLPLPLASPRAAPYREELEAMARDLGAPLLTGALGRKGGEGNPEGSLTNSAYLISPEGVAPGRYDKVHLVPGMERPPAFLPASLGERLFRGRGGSSSETPPATRDVTREFFSSGEEAGVLRTGGWGWAPLICYESLFAELARRQRNRGGQVLVNLTSDVWFGTPGTLPGAPGLRQHAAHMVLRAVETRVPVARAANGGFSFLLDPRGRHLGPEVGPGGGVAVARLPVHPGSTFFAETGDLLGPGAALLCLLGILAGARKGDSTP